MSTEQQLLAISPLDGRYARKVEDLVDIVSEYGLMKRRVFVETQWFLMLSSGIVTEVGPINDDQKAFITSIADTFSVRDAEAVKTIEQDTNHDVKAVELWLRQKFSEKPELNHLLEFIHFGLTSEDVNNLADAMQVRDVRDTIIAPNSSTITDRLTSLINETSDIAMLSHTHGQPASPTTLGKELRVFEARIKQQAASLLSLPIKAKLNGATGNYSALAIAYPEIEWPKISNDFITSLGFQVSPVTTQIEPHDWLAAFCSNMSLQNTILTDLARDMWSYISLGYFTLLVKADEVGSSTMPHKVNPIDFENAEANFGAANAILTWLAAKLPISRLQRDLSDSSALRTLGEAFGHTLIAMQSLQQGLDKISPSRDKIAADLANEWSVLTEAVQTLMRKHGKENAYDLIKQATRGKSLDQSDYQHLVDRLDLPEDAKQILRDLTPQTYVGLAAKLAKSGL